MRFSDWRNRAPTKVSLGPKVVAVIEPILGLLGAGDDASCWIVWGEDPSNRFLMFTISEAGLIQTNVRVNVPQEGPRASGKVVRWNRVQTGELALEMVGGHHIIAFQLEGQLLRGSDADADDIAAFALEVFAAIDGRTHIPRKVVPPRGVASGRTRPVQGSPGWRGREGGYRHEGRDAQ